MNHDMDNIVIIHEIQIKRPGALWQTYLYVYGDEPEATKIFVALPILDGDRLRLVRHTTEEVARR